jgi:hypothetical protein
MPTEQAQKERNLLQSFLMIAIETLLTFLLKHDRMSRLQAQTLIQRRATICFKTHLPSDTFYVTFAPQGVLFDFEISESTKISSTVTASTPDLLRAFFTGNQQSMEKIRVQGDEALEQELRKLMSCFNLPQIFSDWRGWLHLKQKDVTPSSQRLQPLLKRLDEQRTELTQLQLMTREQSYQLDLLKTRYRFFLAVAGITIAALSVTVAYLLWHVQ